MNTGSGSKIGSVFFICIALLYSMAYISQEMFVFRAIFDYIGASVFLDRAEGISTFSEFGAEIFVVFIILLPLILLLFVSVWMWFCPRLDDIDMRAYTVVYFATCVALGWLILFEELFEESGDLKKLAIIFHPLISPAFLTSVVAIVALGGVSIIQYILRKLKLG